MSDGPPKASASPPSTRHVRRKPCRTSALALVHSPRSDSERIQLAKYLVTLAAVERDVGFGGGLQVHAGYLGSRARFDFQPVEQRASVMLALKRRIDAENLQIQMRLLGMILRKHAEQIQRAYDSAPSDCADHPRHLPEPA